MFVFITYFDTEPPEKYKFGIKDNNWVLEPHHEHIFQNLTTDPIYPDEGRIDPSDKKRYLENLHKVKNGSYVKTTELKYE